MGIHYCDFLWGILMGKSYGDVLWGFLKWISNELSWAGLGRLGWAGPCWAGQGWHRLAWDVMGLQSTVENPHKISP